MGGSEFFDGSKEGERALRKDGVLAKPIILMEPLSSIVLYHTVKRTNM